MLILYLQFDSTNGDQEFPFDSIDVENCYITLQFVNDGGSQICVGDLKLYLCGEPGMVF